MEEDQKTKDIKALTELINIAFEEIRRIRAEQKDINFKLDSAITNLTGIAMQQFEILQTQKK